MNVELVRVYCLNKPEVSESFPFDSQTLVFKVSGKMFALLSLDNEPSMNVKCNPALALELRDTYSCVLPGYHMNKVHWNTVVLDGSVADALIYEWIDHSYWIVVSNLPKAKRLPIEKQIFTKE